jgi:hypothetical protein
MWTISDPYLPGDFSSPGPSPSDYPQALHFLEITTILNRRVLQRASEAYRCPLFAGRSN